MLKVSPWKGVVHFGKRGNLNPRYVGPFKVLEKVRSVAYKHELPQELSRVHNTFHVSNLKKCYSDEPLAVPLKGLNVDDKLRFVEEPVEIMDQEVKWLKQSRILIVKVRFHRAQRMQLLIMLVKGLMKNQQIREKEMIKRKKEQLQIKKMARMCKILELNWIICLFNKRKVMLTALTEIVLLDTDDLLNTGIFGGAYNDEDMGAEADLNNLEITISVYRNKKDERGIVFRNKARLVAQGYTQEEGIDYDGVFAHVARIKSIRLFLAYASFMGLIVYQIDVKSAFLYGTIKEEVYMCQPHCFEDPQFPNKVYKVEKALYGLHQAPRAWYETLSTYLLENGYRRGTIDKTLFIKKDRGDILLVQVYVDDIIFGSTKKSLCVEFEQMMHKRFQMSSMRELTFFLGLQVQQKEDGIFISQDKYVADILKKFDFTTVKAASTPIETNKALNKDEEAKDVDVHLYRSMIRSLMYLTASRPDIMFAICACARFQVTPKTSHLHAVKRIFRYLKGQPKLGLWYPRDSPFDLEAFSDIANSTTEAEYVAAANCYRQVLWIQNQMLDYGFNFMNTKIHIDNESTICIVKNPVFHSKTKHIEIRHHFIRDSYEKKLIQVIKIHTDHNVADLLTKAFDVSRFNFLIASIGLLNL
ncbi:putative ribonuclease H-like domain-containing protein [Tanacetum coccineum]